MKSDHWLALITGFIIGTYVGFVAHIVHVDVRAEADAHQQDDHSDMPLGSPLGAREHHTPRREPEQSDICKETNRIRGLAEETGCILWGKENPCEQGFHLEMNGGGGVSCMDNTLGGRSFHDGEAHPGHSSALPPPMMRPSTLATIGGTAR